MVYDRCCRGKAWSSWNTQHWKIDGNRQHNRREGSHGRKDKGNSGVAGSVVQVTKNLNKSLESRRSSSASKTASLRRGDSSSVKDSPAPLAPAARDADSLRESSTVKPSEGDAKPGQPAREDAKVFEVVRRDLLLGP